jgi:Succinylglutamate desuccinylase / Aspartoacylase family
VVGLTRSPIVNRGLRFFLICAFAVALWWGLSYQRDWLFFHWKRHDAVRDVAALGQALSLSGMALEQFGTARYGATALPLWVLRKPALGTPTGTMCLLAGVHGNEPAGVEALLQLAQDLKKNRQKFADLRLVIVPLANPWGWQRNLRHNGDNRDLARQFVAGQAQEARLIKVLFQAEHCDLFLDLHEDRLHSGFYLLAYGPAETQPLQAVLQKIEAAAGVQRSSVGDHGLIAIDTDDLGSQRRTTASLWARMQGIPNAFIVETQDDLPLAQRILIHNLAIDGLSRQITH